MTKFDTTNWRLEKILTVDQAGRTASRLKQEGKTLVTVNGSFDLLHAGHLDQLEEAAAQADVCFVGINTDAAIRAKKGPNRPILPEMARAALLAALICVDYVVIMTGNYDDEPMKSLLTTIRPDIHVNGPDRGAIQSWLEWPVMQQLGIAGYTVKKLNDFSTSAIIKKIILSENSQ